MDQINEVYNAQREWFQAGKTLAKEGRIRKLKMLRRVLIENEQAIYKALKDDLNKPVQEAFLGEFLGMLHEVDTAISGLRRWSRRKYTRSPLIIFPSRASVIAEPYGQVLIISPWNYPIDLCLSPLIGAIAAGNTVMLKPSRFTPHTSMLVKELLGKVFEEEYVSVQTGGAELSNLLLQLRFDYIFFTGSVSVGKEVMKKAAENLTPVSLELGGKCPVVVSGKANLSRAAKCIAWGKYFNAGQSCVAPDYAFVHEKDLDSFITAFSFHCEQFLQKNRGDYTRIINERHFDRLAGYLGQGQVVYGGECSRDELKIYPALILPGSVNCQLMQDEIFGPLLPVITYKNEEEVINFINSREKALTLYIFSESDKEINRYIGCTSSGNVCINDTLLNYVNKSLPFGGVGHSGMGKYHGKASFDTFSHYRSVHRKLGPDVSFRYPPYTGQYEVLKRFKKIFNKDIW
jgi:aldehyde dehydrogenase (NAD+)